MLLGSDPNGGFRVGLGQGEEEVTQVCLVETGWWGSSWKNHMSKDSRSLRMEWRGAQGLLEASSDCPGLYPSSRAYASLCEGHDVPNPPDLLIP